MVMDFNDPTVPVSDQVILMKKGFTKLNPGVNISSVDWYQHMWQRPYRENHQDLTNAYPEYVWYEPQPDTRSKEVIETEKKAEEARRKILAGEPISPVRTGKTIHPTGQVEGGIYGTPPKKDYKGIQKWMQNKYEEQIRVETGESRHGTHKAKVLFIQGAGSVPGWGGIELTNFEIDQTIKLLKELKDSF